MEDKELLEMNIADTIIERPVGFNIGSQQFYLSSYVGDNLSLGKIVQEPGG
jgi:hypothetical protein